MAVAPALFGLLLAVVVSGENVVITPREAVKNIGDQLKVVCKVAHPIQMCRINVGGVNYLLMPDTQWQGDIVYAGQGLQAGECGALIKNIKDQWHGNITCYIPPPSTSTSLNIELEATMKLVVARAPEAPTLVITPASFNEGDILSAKCVVPNGRPAAKITLFLGQEELVDSDAPVVTSEPGSDLETVSRSLSRTMRFEDDTKFLICRATQHALEKPMEVRKQLSVQYSPKLPTATSTIIIYGLKLGAEGRVNVTVRSNPKPSAEWVVGDQELAPPKQSDDGKFTAVEPLPLGNGFYNITLILSRVTKDDVARTYYLRLDNVLGRALYAVRISTLNEPDDMGLDTGAKVRLLVGIIIIIISVFLICFAFAHDRWCFAGLSRRTDIPDGANSEALPPTRTSKARRTRRMTMRTISAMGTRSIRKKIWTPCLRALLHFGAAAT